MPPKIDKSHGFMQSIIKNQVLRDEYDKQQKTLAQTKEAEVQKEMSTLKEQPKRTRTPRRAPLQLYVPPHVKSKDTNEPKETSLNNSPEPTKRSTKDTIVNKEDAKRTRRNKSSSGRMLFKFEYEDDLGNVRILYVKEDDNAEDLAETFGSQLGLTKSLKKALQHKLREEMNSCLNNP